MGDLLAQRQLGFGVKGGAEAAVHAVRLYLQDPETGLQEHLQYHSQGLDAECLGEHAPTLYAFVHYILVAFIPFWMDRTIQSAEWVHQSDPLGPLLFCLSIQHMVTQLELELSLLYLNYNTLGEKCGQPQTWSRGGRARGSRDWATFEQGEIWDHCAHPEILNPIVHCLPGAKIVDPSKATLLGSPIGDVSSVSDAYTTKVNQLKTIGERLQLLSAHGAILLLKHSSLPKLLYNLRTTPCFLSQSCRCTMSSSSQP